MKLAKVFKENKQFTLFSILALVVVGVAVFAPQIAPYDPLDAVMLESLQAPSSAHPFGTDKLGRDLLSRVIFGTALLTCLVYLADMASANVSDGRIIAFRSVLPPATFTQRSCTPKILSKIRPSQKLGTDTPIKVIPLTK